jgi:aminoglycoside phosphotransferase (APT) family kinase protein
MRLIAQGRTCDIFDCTDGTVLRRQRDGRSLESEATVMRHAAAHGFPCPTLHRVDGADMVLDHLDGQTMAQALMADPSPERLRDAGRQLATLHARLHEVPPLQTDDGCLLHLDLHPENVMLTDEGPVVIDWTNATDGPPELDLAMTWVILEPLRVFPQVGDLLDAFLHAAGRGAARRGLSDAVRRRLLDPNVTDDERLAVRALLADAHGS